MRATPKYTSIGVNRSSSCAACSASGILAFGAGRFVALWDIEDQSNGGVYATLSGHTGQVTAVKLVRETDGRAVFVSGDSEGSVRVWQQDGESNFNCTAAFEAHSKSSISALGSAVPGDDPTSLHLLTGSSDATVRYWNVKDGKVTEVQRLDVKGKLPLDLEVGYLPGSNASVLVIGCTDRRIQLWISQNNVWSYTITLEGHEDWVRCLSITPYPSSSSSSTHDLLLASGSQDNYIRLWRISQMTPHQADSPLNGTSGDELDLLDEFERTLAGEAGGHVQISTKAHILAVQSDSQTWKYNVTLEALLFGHEAGLTNIRWSPISALSTSTPVLLSTACDNSLVIWTPSSHDIWVPSQRFGSLGGRGLAFYQAIWGKDGKSVMVGGWNGGWERWVKADQQREEEKWDVRPGLTGHYNEVKSISWDPNGDYLLSVSTDQTARIHACCATSDAGPSTWAEIARPQIHGYDMSDAAWISPWRIASAADEKVARVFDAPGGFVESLQSLGVVKSVKDMDTASRPKGATVPPLGLSNRALGREAVELDLPAARIPNQAHDSVSHTLTSLPTEEEISSSTLWPEVEKIYGHGYELVSIAASHDGKLIASSCKANNLEHGVVRLHSTETWDPIGEPLAGHSLTITRIVFSPDDSRILTCSRDRGWRVFKDVGNGQGFELEAKDEKAHTRMVLDCCWSPDGDQFVTAARDKTFKIWAKSPNDDQWIVTSTLKLTHIPTAVDVVQDGQQLVLAVGTDSGTISLYDMNSQNEVKHLGDVDASLSHVAAVNRLAWRPKRDVVEKGELQLASCSDDRSMRVLRIDLKGQ